MGVVDFTVLGAVQKVRSLVADLSAAPSPQVMTNGGAPETGIGAPPPPRSCSPSSPAARSGGEATASPRRRVSSSGSPRRAFRQVDGEEDDEPGVQFFTPGNDNLHYFSDTDSVSVSTSSEMYRSMTPSPAESPTCMVMQNDAAPTSAKNGCFGQDSYYYGSVGDRSEEDHSSLHPIDFDDYVWCPPPPEDESDDVESRLFGFDDEDDEVVYSSNLLASSSFSSNKVVGIDGVINGAHGENLKNAVLGHFQALVAQLLKGEGISPGSDDNSNNWLEIVSLLAWQAANFVKPDTKKGGSMDPSDYVKVKCIASGNPSDSNFVRGVVCSKNVKHKRMVSEHKNAKLLILGGALEYQKLPNKLASINTILEQEKEHLRTIVSKIKSRQPNVLLVEKSVSSYAQELLAKDISLVLNVKRTLLDRISRCTGGQIASSIDNIASARLGLCEMFKVDKVLELSSPKHTDKRSTKTLMFFEGCPRRLGCTVLLRGTCREELKKIKRAVQLAVFAAYHLSLETSFLADEGATLPRVPSRSMMIVPETRPDKNNLSATSADLGFPGRLQAAEGKYSQTATVSRISEGVVVQDQDSYDTSRSPTAVNAHQDMVFARTTKELCHLENHWNHAPLDDYQVGDQDDQNKLSGGYFPGSDNHQSILVSLSSTCTPKSLVCKRSQLFRIKFYGSFDKPLGRYLREDLFDQAYCCPSCKEPSESHVRCYMHQHGSLTISVRRLLSCKLPGERDGRIWMWHRCMRCKLKDGVPPATHRVIMSDAAWGLSFGKFLELSFSNNVTANRIASCGHSLQRDCLRFYGYGNMVAFFRYSPVDILSVHLPPSVLDFNCHSPQEWMKSEAVEIFGKMDSLHMEVSEFLCSIEKNITEDEPVKTGIQKQIIEMKDLLKMERNEYEALLLPVIRECGHHMQAKIDILELNRLRRGLLLHAYIWDCRLYYIDSLKTNDCISRTDLPNREILLDARMKEWRTELLRGGTWCGEPCYQGTVARLSHSAGSPRKSLLSREGHVKDNECSLDETDVRIELVDGAMDDAGDLDLVFSRFDVQEKGHPISRASVEMVPVERLPSLASIFSDKIDLAWTGSSEFQCDLPQGLTKTDENGSFSLSDNPSNRKAMLPVRIHSFDSILRMHQQQRTGLTPSLPLSKSDDSFGDLTGLLKDPVANMRRAYSHRSPSELEKLNVVLTRTPMYISSASHMVSDGARLLLPQLGSGSAIVIAVYDHEPTSIVSYAMTSQEYVEHVTHKLDAHLSFSHPSKGAEIGCDEHEGSLPPQEDLSDFKETHFKFSFDDETFSVDKAKFSVTCYFARQFAALRKKCCPKDVDYIRSLSRCKRWSAQGGKSNVYFAKTMDERFIIKQVTKTELDSFVEFAPHYFRHLTESLTSGSPTCLAKLMGLYQVNIKGLKGGREVKMDLMVMENLFFQRKISRVYDLKGSERSRYNSDTSGQNKVLLDSNLIEALNAKPIFLGSRAKRRLERAIWNDTSFLALMDVMDYSLLVGIDEEKKELVIGIIDFLRQYTWDKQLETWVKASGILGGSKNEPTVISPMQYKRRFRKAMSKYFLTVPGN